MTKASQKKLVLKSHRKGIMLVVFWDVVLSNWTQQKASENVNLPP